MDSFSNPVRLTCLCDLSLVSTAIMHAQRCSVLSELCTPTSSWLPFPSQGVPHLAPPCLSTPASALAVLGRLRPAPWPHSVVGNHLLPGSQTEFFSFVSPLCLSQPSEKLISRNPDQALGFVGAGRGTCLAVWHWAAPLWGLGFLSMGTTILAHALHRLTVRL